MSGLGEFDLIDALVARLDNAVGGPTAGDGLGIGDDAAAWRPTPGTAVVATTDMLVESIHFRLDWTTPRDLGWKALAVNLSDLAAMGARPGRGLVSVGLIPSQAALVEELYAGMNELARQTGTLIVGGDTVRSPGPLIINVALLGEADPDRLLRRSGARPGDVLVLTGPVGASAAGLELLQRGTAAQAKPGPAAAAPEAATLARPEAAALLRAHHRPFPQLAAGATLAAHGVRCAIDVSDGVASEAWHVARASGVAIEIDVDRLPLAAEAVALFGEERARDMALSGGEDYQLLFAVPEARMEEVASALSGECLPVAIGRVSAAHAGGDVALLRRGLRIEPASAGYTAF